MISPVKYNDQSSPDKKPVLPQARDLSTVIPEDVVNPESSVLSSTSEIASFQFVTSPVLFYDVSSGCQGAVVADVGDTYVSGDQKSDLTPFASSRNVFSVLK